MKKVEILFTAVLVPIDFVMLMSAAVAAYLFRTSHWVAGYRPVLFELNLPLSRYLYLSIFVAIFMLFVFALVGLYKMQIRRYVWSDFTKLVIGVTAGIMIVVFYIFLRQELFDSRFLLLAGWALAIIFVVLGRALVAIWQRFLIRKYHYGAHRVLIIGDDSITQSVIGQIESDPGLGYVLVDNLKNPDLTKVTDRLKKNGVDEIILSDPNWPKSNFRELVNYCDDHHLVFKFVPNLYQSLTRNSTIGTLGTIPLVEIKRFVLDGWGRIIKRLFDIVFALLFIVVFSWLYLLVFLAIKISSPGPAIYKDYRYGHKKKKFVFYKFRYMKADLCDGEFGTKKGNEMLKKLEKDQSANIRKGSPLHKIKDDPRITRVGRFIRKYSLDELPQFFNVLKGDMSIVGYRPHMSYEVEKYTKEQEKMFIGKPGITGLAQISGRSDLDFDEEVKLDLFYIENWTLALDFIIVLKTPFILLFKRQKA